MGTINHAETNAEADAKRRQLIEAKNEIDALVYSTEKSLTDNGDKLDEETKTAVETAVKEAKDGEDLELITKKKEALSEASMKIGQAMYASQAKDGEEKKDDDDTTQDAEFTEKQKDGDADADEDTTKKEEDAADSKKEEDKK